AARRAIAENRAADAMIELQALFDAASDVFVWLGEDGAPAPARVCAAELFRQLPASAIAEYERRYGPDAQRLYDESRREPDGAAHRELLRRFEFTTAGAAAVCAAADTALDRGEFAEAARLYRRWLSHPAAARIRDDEIRLRAEAAVLLAG